MQNCPSKKNLFSGNSTFMIEKRMGGGFQKSSKLIELISSILSSEFGDVNSRKSDPVEELR